MRSIRVLGGALIVALACCGQAALAQHGGGEGHSDIEFGILNGKIVIDPYGEAPFTDYLGRKIFEGDFEYDPMLGFAGTDDPGFGSELEFIAPPYSLPPANTPFSVIPHGSLLFWNGLSWGAAGLDGETVRGSQTRGPALLWEIVFDGSGFTVNDPGAPNAGLIGTSFANGEFHEHFDFTLERNAFTLEPQDGAYAILFSLSAPGLMTSDQFYIAFNKGMPHESFDGALEVLAVPEPSTYALMALGLVALVALRRGRRQI